MDPKNLSTKFIRVEYPGIVRNVDNMLVTLGGINAASEVRTTRPTFYKLKKKNK